MNRLKFLSALKNQSIINICLSRNLKNLLLHKHTNILILINTIYEYSKTKLLLLLKYTRKYICFVVLISGFVVEFLLA